jgi:hypothetical protein
VADAIAKYAFIASEYPLILSLEVHCSLEQQVKMTSIFKEGFGFAKPFCYIYVIIKVMMNQEEIYQAEQELARFNELMSKEVLTQEEYEFCKVWDAEEAKNLVHIIWNNTYLNLNL